MRTNIEIDDELMQKAMAASNATTKRAVVEQALRLLVDIRGQRAIRELWGKVEWRGHDDDWSVPLQEGQEMSGTILEAPVAQGLVDEHGDR